MMRVWDNELLISRGAKVVEDGLLSWTDFRDVITVASSNQYGYATGTITDRVTGELLPIKARNNVENIYFTQENGFLCLYTQTGLSREKAIIPASPITGIKAIEFIYADETDASATTEWWQAMFASTVQSLYVRGECRVTSLGKVFRDPLIGTAQPAHYFVQINDGYLEMFMNGQRMLMASVSATAFATSNNNGLFLVNRKRGSNETPPTPPLRVGFIRLYNRPLSRDELAQNIQYETEAGRLIL